MDPTPYFDKTKFIKENTILKSQQVYGVTHAEQHREELPVLKECILVAVYTEHSIRIQAHAVLDIWQVFLYTHPQTEVG